MHSVRGVVAPALVAAVLLSSCSFEGAKGTQQPDGEAQPDGAMPDGPMADAPPRVVCDADFKKIGASSYKFVDEMKDWNNAISRCRDFQNAHLVTFETVAEVGEVKTGLPLTTSVWSAIFQPPGAQMPSLGWFNQIGPIRSAAPQPFPWRGTEPNDGGGSGNTVELNREDFAELQQEGLFDDAPDTRLSRVLCECTPTP